MYLLAINIYYTLHVQVNLNWYGFFWLARVPHSLIIGPSEHKMFTLEQLIEDHSWQKSVCTCYLKLLLVGLFTALNGFVT